MLGKNVALVVFRTQIISHGELLLSNDNFFCQAKFLRYVIRAVRWTITMLAVRVFLPSHMPGTAYLISTDRSQAKASWC